MSNQKPCIVGYACGLVLENTRGGGFKAPCLTTELAHRTNSYGLPHVLVYEYIEPEQMTIEDTDGIL